MRNYPHLKEKVKEVETESCGSRWCSIVAKQGKGHCREEGETTPPLLSRKGGEGM